MYYFPQSQSQIVRATNLQDINFFLKISSKNHLLALHLTLSCLTCSHSWPRFKEAH